MKYLLSLIFILGFIFRASADNTPLQIPFCADSLKIDGKLNEAFYQKTVPMVLNKFPVSKLPPEQKTMVWLWRDESSIYIAFKCFENNIKNLAKAITETNGMVYTDDCVEVFLNPDACRQNYYHFILNSLGTRYTAYVSNTLNVEKEFENEWQAASFCKWQAASTIADTYWCAEIKIPFLQFIWGEKYSLNLCRERRAGKQELSSLAQIKGGNFHTPGAFVPLEHWAGLGEISIRDISRLAFAPALNNVIGIDTNNDEQAEQMKVVLTLTPENKGDKTRIFEKNYQLKGRKKADVLFDYFLPRGKYANYQLSVYLDNKLRFLREAAVPRFFNIVIPGNIFYRGEKVPVTILNNFPFPKQYRYRILLTNGKVSSTLLDNIEYDNKVDIILTLSGISKGKYFLTFQLVDAKNNITGEISNEIEIVDI
ncbi:MAG: carbohydrate-binding family 9-like protein [Victivallaceae bacterium]|nr:carbohydrate-binding family 9-like protein [Victivallaceae bacterium]